MKSKNCNDLLFSPGSRFGRLHPEGAQRTKGRLRDAAQGAASILGDLMGDVANDEKNGERFDDTIFFMEMWMMFLFADLFLLMFHGFSQLQASGKVWRDPTLDDWPKEDYRSGFRRIGSVVYQLIGI